MATSETAPEARLASDIRGELYVVSCAFGRRSAAGIRARENTPDSPHCLDLTRSPCCRGNDRYLRIPAVHGSVFEPHDDVPSRRSRPGCADPNSGPPGGSWEALEPRPVGVDVAMYTTGRGGRRHRLCPRHFAYSRLWRSQLGRGRRPTLLPSDRRPTRPMGQIAVVGGMRRLRQLRSFMKQALNASFRPVTVLPWHLTRLPATGRAFRTRIAACEGGEAVEERRGAKRCPTVSAAHCVDSASDDGSV